MAQTHIVLDARIVNQVWIIVQDHLSCDVIELLLALFILALFIVTNRCQRTPMTDNLWYAALLRQISPLGLFSQKLVLIFKARDFKKGFTMVTDDVISNFDLLGQLRVFNTNETFAPHNLLLAVEEELLTGFDLDGGLPALNVTQTHPRSLQVNIDATFLAGNFGGFSHHFYQYFMLLVLDLSRVDPADVHALP